MTVDSPLSLELDIGCARPSLAVTDSLHGSHDSLSVRFHDREELDDLQSNRNGVLDVHEIVCAQACGERLEVSSCNSGMSFDIPR